MRKILCHGGAGRAGANQEAKNAVVARAAALGMEVLKLNGSAVDAVTAAVSLMEDDPLLNAGTGSYVQMDGMVRMDASIMDARLNVGAVIGIRDVKNPIQVARRIMDLGIHSVLGGDLATDFARTEGFEPYDPRTVEKLETWLELRRKYVRMNNLNLMHVLREEMRREEALGTVGCVALDGRGQLAAGTSTGGLKLDLPGRVGDVPLIGCGTYACEHAAVSCTGVGEKIIKVCLAKTVAEAARRGLPPEEACRLGMTEIEEVGGRAGVICLDGQGRGASLWNTEAMTFCQLEEK
jgi:beta-aspartyl-peptidase (threonine type)